MGLSLFDSDKRRTGLFPSPKVIAEGVGFPDTDGEKSNGRLVSFLSPLATGRRGLREASPPSSKWFQSL